MHRFAEFRNRYVAECRTSFIAFLLSFVLLMPILAWQYQIYMVYALPVALIIAVPSIALFCAVIALGNSVALRVGTLAVAIAVNLFVLQEALLNRIEHFGADGQVLATNQNTFPVMFWQLFLAFAAFYALLAHRRLTEWRARAAAENG